MRILVFGATGGTGGQVVAQALEQGHDVTAFVRDPQRLAISHGRLRVVTGSIGAEAGPVAEAVRGRDVVISALGVGASFKSGGLIARATPALVAAMEAEGVRRLIFASAFGVGGTRADTPLVPRIFQRVLLRDVYADKTAGEEQVRASRLDWTIVQPVGLTNGPRTGRCRHGEHLALRGFPTIARADVADFILAQLTDSTYLRKVVLVSS